MSLTSYRAAPPRVKFCGLGSAAGGRDPTGRRLVLGIEGEGDEPYFAGLATTYSPVS